MSIHKWRKRPTKYFGDVWVPFAKIQIRSENGLSRTFALQVDSGAVVSLLRRSAAEILQVPFESGQPIELSGVGGGSTRAFVHQLRTRFAPNVELDVPFAIADSERVPNLLGRLGVFDELQIQFDATFTETKVMAPWLSPVERKIWDFLVSTERHILDRWAELPYSIIAKEALNRLFKRGQQLFATAAGLLQLHRTFDGPLIVRALFEHAAQTIYLLQDVENRAKDYIDYQHITQHLYPQRIVRNSTGPIGQKLANSPLRSEGEKRNQEEFERVKHRYMRNNGEVWDRWYCKSLFDLTREIGWEGEYRYWYAIGSAWSHGNSFFARRSSGFGGNDHQEVFTMAFTLYGRMLRAVSRGLILTNEQHQFFERVNKASF